MLKQQLVDKVNEEMLPLNAVSSQKTGEIIIDVIDFVDDKVDKVEGYDLSQENFTTSEKNKLANLSEHFKGYYTSYANLVAGAPTGVAGDYANVDIGPGEDVKMYIWDVDGAEWVLSSGGGIIPDATETLAGIIEIATIAEALARTDDMRAMTAFKTIALILDEKKKRRKEMNAIGVQEVSFGMLEAGNILEGTVLGGENLRFKIERAGTYPSGSQSYPFAYPANSRVFATFDFIDDFYSDCNIILKVKDN